MFFLSNQTENHSANNRNNFKSNLCALFLFAHRHNLS